MGHTQARKGYLRRQKDRQLEGEKAAVRKLKGVRMMGRATEGYKANIYTQMQHLQDCLTETTEDLHVSQRTAKKYQEAWEAEKRINKALAILHNGDINKHKRATRDWEILSGVMTGVALFLLFLLMLKLW